MDNNKNMYHLQANPCNFKKVHQNFEIKSLHGFVKNKCRLLHVKDIQQRAKQTDH